MSTKSDSLCRLVTRGEAKRVDDLVLETLHLRTVPVSRDALCNLLDIRISTMCGVLDRLQRRKLVEERGTVYNDATRRTVKAYRAVLTT